MDDKGKILYWNISLLAQMNSVVFENPIAREAFSFEQLLEIVSIKDTENVLKEILKNPVSRELLINIGKDTQCWREKFQYIIDLEEIKRNQLINEFGIDGNGLVQKELERRERLFNYMEKGYYEDEEYGMIIDIEITPPNILSAILGITNDEANELVKKYGIDSDKLVIQNDDDKKILRKLQIIKDLVTPIDFKSDEEEYEYYKKYYYSHKEELIDISKEDITPFYKVDLEKKLFDLYARQYDRTMGVKADRIQDVSYNGKNIPVYEVIGDFIMLIRGEQNVSPQNEQNFWDSTQLQVKGLCHNTISQDYIRTVSYDGDDICFVGTTSCKDGELRMASTTNIKSKEANIAISNLGIKSDYGNGVVLRIPREQINNSRGTNNETDTSRNVFNSETGLYERKKSEYIVYIQDTNDTDIMHDSRFKTAQFAASQTESSILIIPREKCAQRELAKIQELKDKLLGKTERVQGENDESIIKDLIVKFNNNREGILTSEGLKEKYFTEGEHIDLVGTINARLSQLKVSDIKQYESLVQKVSQIYKDEIDKYYAFSYDRDDAQKDLNIDSTREHLKPYEDFLLEYERNIFDLSDDEKDKIFGIIKNISKTSYYDMNINHSLSHIQKVIMFSGILAKNEGLSLEETDILLAAAAFHDSGRAGKEDEFDNHALASAIQVKEYFEANPNNPFGITVENISIIQAVIEYHEHKEPEKGVTDNKKLISLAQKYNINEEKFSSLVKISNFLKDADALDRARFGKKNENRWSLDARFLKSDTAKSISMLKFSERCNSVFKEREEQDLEGISENDVEEIFENELNDFCRPKVQMSSLKQTTSEMTAIQKRTVMKNLRGILASLKKDVLNYFNR